MTRAASGRRSFSCTAGRNGAGKLMPSPFKFAPHGKSGIEVSEIYPELAGCVDGLCVLRSMYTDNPNHEPGLLLMNSGIFQGTHINNRSIDPKTIIRDVRNRYLPPLAQRAQLDLLQEMNRTHLEQRERDEQLEARIASLEMAFRMQGEAQDAFDIGKETADTRKLYGDGEFANACLIARRLAERGVRMTQIYYGDGQPWDDHSDINNHRNHASKSDRPIAALLKDLKSRGLLEDTLVIWGGEFGRT